MCTLQNAAAAADINANCSRHQSKEWQCMLLKDSLSSTASSLHPGNRRELLHVNETEEEEEEGKPHYLCLSLLFCLSVSVCERV